MGRMGGNQISQTIENLSSAHFRVGQTEAWVCWDSNPISSPVLVFGYNTIVLFRVTLLLSSKRRDSQLCVNPGSAASAPPGAGSQQRLVCGFPARALGVGLVTGMRSLLTSGWGRMPRFGNLHSEPLVDLVCVCVCKKNKPVGWDFVLGL